jgi:hypothetical protein
MTIELLDGRRVEIRPLPAPEFESGEDQHLRRLLRELTVRGAKLAWLGRRRLGRELVHGAVMRALPAETPRSLEGLCHTGHVTQVAAGLGGAAYRSYRAYRTYEAPKEPS